MYCNQCYHVTMKDTQELTLKCEVLLLFPVLYLVDYIWVSNNPFAQCQSNTLVHTETTI